MNIQDEERGAIRHTISFLRNMEQAAMVVALEAKSDPSRRRYKTWQSTCYGEAADLLEVELNADKM